MSNQNKTQGQLLEEQLLMAPKTERRYSRMRRLPKPTSSAKGIRPFEMRQNRAGGSGSDGQNLKGSRLRGV